MQSLEELGKRSAKLPAQAQATVYGTLNMHVEPYRTATSFYQLNEGTQVAVIGHRTTPKSYVPENTNTLDIVQAHSPAAGKEEERACLSASATSGSSGAAARVARDCPKAVCPSRLRLRRRKSFRQEKKETQAETGRTAYGGLDAGPHKDGKSGWVLSRMLVMTHSG